jgi:Ser/Thr protein kinase RdoA (MazF antagonist)
MNIFPATASTLSSDHLNQLVKQRYGLNENTTCRLFRTGINHTYFISEHDQKYVLRVYSFNWRTSSEIEEEIRLLNFLNENNIGVSYPILDIEGSYIQKINAAEGLRYAVLFSFADGGKIRYMTENTCASVGTLMAEIHRATRQQKIQRIEYTSEILWQSPYVFASRYFSESLEEMQFVKKAGELLNSLFDWTDHEKVRTGIVHLDIWYDNMSISGEDEITLFDFDFCGKGYLVLDIAYFCMQLFHIEPDKKIYELKVKNFLKGYQQVSLISNEEQKLIPYAGLAVWIFYLGVQSQRFDWSNIFLSENYLKMYIGKVKDWLRYHEIEIGVPALLS